MIAERHGGAIKVYSTLGKGTAVVFEISLAKKDFKIVRVDQ